MAADSPLRVPVLMYHEIVGIAETQSALAVSPEAFADQLAYLRGAGFNAITAGELYTILANGNRDLPERPIVLTFDDGYADFHSQALPLLKQNDFTATLFVTTGWIGKEGNDGKWRRMLDWRELTEVQQAGIEIGAHTCKHPKLDQLPEKLVREELSVSKNLIEDRLGLEVPGIAYPFGYSNAMVRRVADELGYVYGYSVGNSLTTSAAGKFTLPRLTVSRSTTMDEFRKIVNGQDTMAIRRERFLSKGFSVIRRARSAMGGGRQPEWYYLAES